LENHKDLDTKAQDNSGEANDYEPQNLENCKDLDNEEELEEVKESQELGGSANDWNQANQSWKQKQKLNEWLIDSGASVHMIIQKEDLHEPKPIMQAVTIGSGKLCWLKPWDLSLQNSKIASKKITE